jgi:hypothetical protein
VQRSSGALTRSPRRVALTDADLELLRFLAEHRFLLNEHAAALGGVTQQTANRRLTRLVESGYARREPGFRGQSPLHLITYGGLRALGSKLPTPRPDLQNYEHDVGLAWLWLAARNGTFGPLREILAERTLRSREGSRAQGAEHFAVRLGGRGPGGRESVHYPDLLLTTADGRRVAVELELSGKERTRLETILSGYGADPRIAGVVYLVESQSVARSVERAARKVGVSDLVRLQRVRLKTARPTAASAAAMERSTAATQSSTALSRTARGAAR